MPKKSSITIPSVFHTFRNTGRFKNFFHPKEINSRHPSTNCMARPLPQEIDIWYTYPAIRRALVKIFIEEYHYSQKQCAKLLSVTEAAISQYRKDKRAALPLFTPKEMIELHKTAKKIVEDPSESAKHLFKLCTALRGSKSLCDAFCKDNPEVPHDCKLCKE